MNILKRSIAASFSLIALSSLMTGCVPEGLKPLPDEQRYSRIDRVLNDIDYQNIGEIVREEKDKTGSTLTPAFKTVYYKDKDSFEKIANNLNEVSEDCNIPKKTDSVSCTHLFLSVWYSKHEGSEYGASLRVTDGMGGRDR